MTLIDLYYESINLNYKELLYFQIDNKRTDFPLNH